jgi:hypothetical protein
MSRRELVGAFEVANKMAYMNISESRCYFFYAKRTAFEEFSPSVESGFNQAPLQTLASFSFEQMP